MAVYVLLVCRDEDTEVHLIYLHETYRALQPFALKLSMFKNYAVSHIPIST
jgi:hypothetical protein